MRSCGHTEGDFNSQGILVDCHDCVYVDAINRLIPKAEKLADELLQGKFDLEDKKQLSLHRYAWDRAFHQAMNDLAAKAGIRKSMPSYGNGTSYAAA